MITLFSRVSVNEFLFIRKLWQRILPFTSATCSYAMRCLRDYVREHPYKTRRTPSQHAEVENSVRINTMFVLFIHVFITEFHLAQITNQIQHYELGDKNVKSVIQNRGFIHLILLAVIRIQTVTEKSPVFLLMITFLFTDNNI